MSKSNNSKLTIVEKGSRTLQSTLIDTNPTATGKCGRSKFKKSKDDPLIPCIMCSEGSVGCDKQNINYQFSCMVDRWMQGRGGHNAPFSKL